MPKLLPLYCAVGEPRSSDIWFCFIHFRTGPELRHSHNSETFTLDDMKYVTTLKNKFPPPPPPIC